MTTTVYTDGACIGNPGAGGWAWAVPGGAYGSGAQPATTNQRMELTAALAALRVISGAVVVVSDSKYVVDGFNVRWYEAWERQGWRNAKREPVANQDLWKPLVEIFRARAGELTFRWVKGHGGDPTNDLVDRLALEAATMQTGRQGDGPPAEVGVADDPGPRRAVPKVTGPPAPAGHLLVVFGHRAADLGGYDDNPVAAGVRRKIIEILDGVRQVQPDVVVLTGLGLGTEQLAAQAAADARVPYVAVWAFPNQEKVWPPATQDTYGRLVEGAASTISLSRKEPATKAAAGKALGLRQQWMIAHADSAIVVWDGKDATIGAINRALHQRLPDDVWIIQP
jgi:ribonuclease HI